MIQRIQSVFLLIAILINLGTFFVPMWQFSSGAGTELITGLSVESADLLSEGSRSVSFSEHENDTKKLAHTAFLALTVISSLFLAFVIFQFNNRKRQISLAYIGIVLILLEIMAFVLLSQQEPSFITGATPNSVAHFGFAFPVVAVVMTWMAINRIRKDDELVRSVDRLR